MCFTRFAISLPRQARHVTSTNVQKPVSMWTERLLRVATLAMPRACDACFMLTVLTCSALFLRTRLHTLLLS